jgi:hypothetical protein
VLRPLEVERWIEADHPARAIWELVGQQELTGFYAPIKAGQEGVSAPPPGRKNRGVPPWQAEKT